MQKKILIVCGTLESGGAERVISILSKPFAAKYQNVKIITWRHAPIFYKIDSRVEILPLPSEATSHNLIIKLFAFRKLVKKEHPDLILSFLTIFNMFTLVSLLGIKIPIIVAERNDPRFIKGGGLIKFIRNLLYLKASGILCQTQSIKDYFKGKLRQKSDIIYNPVVIPDNLIGKAIKTPKKNRIVTIGRLHPQKNQKLLINSFIEFHKSHPDYILSIYGKGELEDELSKYINDVSMTNFIELVGEQKDVYQLILDSKVFVLSSDFEGMPNALIEAMSLGLPCISTKVSGAIDLIENEINGILVDSNTKSISNALNKLVDNPDFANSIAHNAVDVHKKLNIDHISNLWIKYLDRHMFLSD